MSEKMTRLKLPGAKAFSGIMDYGELEAADIIRQARAYADHLANQVNEIRRAADNQFQIDIVRGSAVQHHVRSVQDASTAACEGCMGMGVDSITGFACPSCYPVLMQPSKKEKQSPLAAFLRETARYFERRETNGEDKAHWANVYNADNCRQAADFIDRFWDEAYARESD